MLNSQAAEARKRKGEASGDTPPERTNDGIFPAGLIGPDNPDKSDLDKIVSFRKREKCRWGAGSRNFFDDSLYSTTREIQSTFLRSFPTSVLGPFVVIA